MTIAGAQPRCVSGEVRANAITHAEAVSTAEARLVVFPELSLTGYELDATPVALDDPALRPLIAACTAADAIALVGAPIDEGGRRSIATLQVDANGARVAYRKSHLGGDEPAHFAPGDGPTALNIDGWRVGVGICKDTGVDAHIDGVARLGIDVYVAGLVHRPEELDEQDARGQRIARTSDATVVFASFAGATGGGFDRTAGTSTAWAPDGTQLARASAEPGDLVLISLASNGTGSEP
ncbi:MAG: hypothetical protein V7607_2571 [Solirubrobacteraceae bacterium]